MKGDGGRPSIARIQRKYQLLAPEMDERSAGSGRRPRRGNWAGAASRSWPAPPGCLARRSRPGLRELDQPDPATCGEAARVRRPGGGRRPLTETDPGLLAALESLVEPVTRGDPESPLRWTCKSTRRLAEELTRQGPSVGPRTVAGLLHEAGYSLQANRKTREGLDHPDRNAQFEYINASVARCAAPGPAGDLGRHEEEGIGRRFQERRPGVAAARGSPRRSASTTSSTRPWARRSPTASTTWSTTRAGSASASTTTRPSSRPTASAAGGTRWASVAFPRPRSC